MTYRRHFDVRKLIARHHMGAPHAGNFYMVGVGAAAMIYDKKKKESIKNDLR